MSVAGREVFYLEEATLADSMIPVRGGNPVLFPSPGALTDGRFTRAGRSGAMKLHGLARVRAFEVESSSASTATLVLASDPSMADEFPWSFVLTLRYELEDGVLRVTQRIHNRDHEPLPFAIGFHPFFAITESGKPRAFVPTTATRGWDNVVKRDVPIEGPVRFGAGAVDLVLYDHGRPTAELVMGDGMRIVVSASDAVGCWVLVSIPGRDFLCLEPWTAPPNALVTGESLLVVPPGETLELWTQYAFVDDERP
jgi:galactose mutarotase-like enzyme